jgi:hypothetical protein
MAIVFETFIKAGKNQLITGKIYNKLCFFTGSTLQLTGHALFAGAS